MENSLVTEVHSVHRSPCKVKAGIQNLGFLPNVDLWQCLCLYGVGRLLLLLLLLLLLCYSGFIIVVAIGIVCLSFYSDQRKR